ncbi:MAG TPA: non-homologous end-joining DNA ligase [Longimicrobiaceae bacterium]|nr:non-homologous end-joining DNA ligase [Longimicrobiaceae bacterium]
MSPQSTRGPAARRRKPPAAVVRAADATPDIIPARGKACEVRVGGKTVRLTNLHKPFWPELGLTKGDLLRYYVAVSEWLLPHLKDRAMVMKRYPNGWNGPFFFMKRTPEHAPAWLKTCSIEHASKSVIDFPMVQDLATLLWVVNLGCIDLNQWYARCDDTDRPDYLHFDLDPVPGADFERVRQTALMVRDALRKLGMKSYPKTTGSKGIHVYVPIVRGPTQKQVWAFAKEFARAMEALDPALVTAEYRVAKRPAGRVLVDYNQNAWGRTLASVYSVRPRPQATVSTPVTWEEIEGGVRLEDFTLRNLPERLRERGDLFRPLLLARGRVDLSPFLVAAKKRGGR